MPIAQKAILSSSYLPPIQYFHKLIEYDECVIEHTENYLKQTYQSRCHIYSPNGMQILSVPIVNRNHKQIIKDTKVSYDTDWQKLHWRSIEAAYRRSPYFEFYEDDLRPHYLDKKPHYLVDHNESLLATLISLLSISTHTKSTTTYQKEYPNNDDYRALISPKMSLTQDSSFSVKPYLQVFENKYGFIENLSIIDLLFNQGPQSKHYI